MRRGKKSIARVLHFYAQRSTLLYITAKDDAMKLPDAKRLAEQLMREHGLIDNPIDGSSWRFDFDKAVRRFGATHYGLRLITLSAKLVELNDEPRVRNTILHEIAHALCGHKAGHGKSWVTMAKAIGCDGNRLYSSAVVIQPRRSYVGTCPNCGKVVHAYRRNKIACGTCCKKHNGGRFTAEYLFTWRTQ